MGIVIFPSEITQQALRDAAAMQKNRPNPATLPRENLREGNNEMER